MISSPQASRWLSPKLVVGGCVVPGSSEKSGLRRRGRSPITHGQTLTCGIGIPLVVGSTANIPIGLKFNSGVVHVIKDFRDCLNNSDLNTGGVDVSAVGILEASVSSSSDFTLLWHDQNDRPSRS